MDCKKALVESDGDVQGAIDYLRKKGAKLAEIRSGREANEGAVIAKTTEDGKRGVIVHLSCETDFVSGKPRACPGSMFPLIIAPCQHPGVSQVAQTRLCST